VTWQYDGPTTRVKAQTTAFSFCSNNNNTVSIFSLYFSFYFSFHFFHSSFFIFKEKTQHKFHIKNKEQEEEEEEKTQLQQVNPIHMEVFFLFFLPKRFLDILLVNSFVFTPHDFHFFCIFFAIFF